MKFLKALFRKLKFWDQAAAKAITNPIEERKLVLDEAEKVINSFKNVIAESMAHLKLSQDMLAKKKSEIEKYQSLAKLAIGKGEDDKARQFLTTVDSLKKEVVELEKDIAADNKFIELNRKKLTAETNKISSAKSQTVRLEAKSKAADTRAKLSELRGSEAFEAVDRLENEVDTKLNYADALDELNSDSISELEQEFENDIASASVEDALAALKAEMNQEN